jgi:hypothetical protein
MNAHRRCRCRTGSAALFCGLADPLADVIPIVGRNALSDGAGVTDVFEMSPFGLHVIVHLNTRKPLDSTMPKRGAPARMASAI